MAVTRAQREAEYAIVAVPLLHLALGLAPVVAVSVFLAFALGSRSPSFFGFLGVLNVSPVLWWLVVGWYAVALGLVRGFGSATVSPLAGIPGMVALAVGVSALLPSAAPLLLRSALRLYAPQAVAALLCMLVYLVARRVRS